MIRHDDDNVWGTDEIYTDERERTKRVTYPVYYTSIEFSVCLCVCVCVCVLTGLQREVINFNGMPNKNGRRRRRSAAGGDREGEEGKC